MRPIPTESVADVSESVRSARYEDAWEEGSLAGITSAFDDLMIDQAANHTAANFIRSKIRGIVDNPATVGTLCPTNHPFATKRPCLDTN